MYFKTHGWEWFRCSCGTPVKCWAPPTKKDPVICERCFASQHKTFEKGKKK